MRAANARLRGRYFTSALPRALLGAAPLVLLGVLWERRLWPQAAAALLYVLLYSTLPHKARPRARQAAALALLDAAGQRLTVCMAP
jgi:hypothetical protein